MADGGRLEREFRTLAPKLQVRLGGVVMGILVKGNLIGRELLEIMPQALNWDPFESFSRMTISTLKQHLTLKQNGFEPQGPFTCGFFFPLIDIL